MVWCVVSSRAPECVHERRGEGELVDGLVKVKRQGKQAPHRLVSRKAKQSTIFS